MAFCTECGSKLPDDAVFCPNCGKSMASTAKNESIAPSEIIQEEIKTIEYAAPAAAEAKPEPTAFQTSGVYVAPTQASYSAPAQGTYAPPEQNAYVPPQNNYAPPYQGGYAPQPQNQYNQPNSYGYQPYQGMPPKKSGGKTAIIVISSVVAVIIIAIVLILALGKDPYVGYWETVSVDTGDGLTEDYYGTSIVGSLSMQINSDGSAYLASAYNTEVYEGTWEETDNGIEISANDETHDFEYEDNQLIMTEDGETFYFEQVDGDINNPSVPHGSSADTSVDTSTEETSGTVAGSGYVGDGDFYISIVGAEDFTDIDGEPAIRVFYEFTNNYYDDYSSSAYDMLSYYATQDGYDLDQTYSSDDYSVANNIYYNIRVGLTMQCAAEFKYDPYGGSVDFGICDYYDGESAGAVYASYVPGSFPGAPAPYVIAPIDDPQWTLGLPTEGALDSFYVAVTDAEQTTDADGNPAIRVYYEFTNNSTYSTNLYTELYIYTYQDGVSLDQAYTYEESETDSNFYSDIAPGASINTSCVYVLRNQSSPVEAEVEAYTDYAAVGQLFYFN